MLALRDWSGRRLEARRSMIPSLPAIAAPRRRRLVDDDLGEARTLRRELFPKPRGHVFDRRIFESGDFIQVGMIKHLHERLHRPADDGMIVKPSRRGIGPAFHAHFDLKTMPVHLPAFVTLRRTRQSLRGFEGEVFGEANFHWQST